MVKIGAILDLNRVARDIFISIFSRHPVSREVERLAAAGAQHIEFTLDLLYSNPKAKDIFTQERGRLKEIRESTGLTYSFHLPTTGGFSTASCWEGVRLGSVAWLQEFVEWTKPFQPTAYVMHPRSLEELCHVDLGPMEGGWVPQRKIFEYFTESIIIPNEQASISEIRSFINLSLICLENSDSADFSLLGNFPLTCGYSVCMDVGHLYLWKQSVREFISKFRSVLSHVHLHDVIEDPEKHPWGRRDHCSLGTGMVDLREVATELEKINFDGPVVIEDYYQDPVGSIRHFKKILEELKISTGAVGT